MRLLLLFISSTVFAAEQTIILPVRTGVESYCTISASPLVFDNYDPVVAHFTTPYHSEGSVTVTCTKGTAATISLDLGEHALGSTRRMQASNNRHLTYELYQDSNRLTIWGNNTASKTPPLAPSKNPRTYIVYGRIFPGQNVSSGTYNDLVRATVSF